MARRSSTPPPVNPSADPREEMLKMFLPFVGMDPEERAKQLTELAKSISPEGRQAIANLYEWFETNKYLVHEARAYTLDGFKAFYKLMHSFLPPQHVADEVAAILGSAGRDKGVEILASRGSWKTTSIALTFVPWFIGHHPTTANLIIQANDASASATALAISETIRVHPAFANVFPHVVPHPEKKWSEDGYEVRMTHTDYTRTKEISAGEWQKMVAARKDPTLLALSYSSKSVVGKHPTGLFLIDDIHDEENTKSQAMLDDVLKKLTGTILPMVFSLRNESAPVGQQLQTTIVAVGTPWVEGDAMQYLRETGEFEVFEFPVIQEVSPDTPGAVRLDHTSPRGEELRGWFRFNWPEKFGINATLAAFNVSGDHDFSRMYMLIFKARKGEGVRFVLYPAHLIDATQDAAGGIDYASMLAERKKNPKDRSRFAHVVGVKIPHLNKVVVHKCFAEHVTQLEAENELESTQGLYPNFRGDRFESDGVGAEAIQTFSRKPRLKIIPSPTKGMEKNRRHETGVIPWFQIGQLMVSDENEPGLNFLRTALAKWPNGNLDVWDALWHMCKAFPEVFHLPDTTEGARKRPMREKQISNPWLSFQRT